MNLAYPINTAWMISCKRSLRAFRRSTTNVSDTQSRLLGQIVQANRASVFGREHGLSMIREVDDFRSRVPIADYESFEPWIDQICEGHSQVLTHEPVRLLEPTSGSVSGRRLIPYTDSLRRQFRSGINPWIADLFSKRSRLRRGRAYWMVTPAIESQQTAGGLTIGFADDTQYLGLAGRLAAKSVMAVPPWTMAGVPAVEAPYRTMLELLSTPDLSLISVWSPTFLTSLARVLDDSRSELIRDLQESGRGTSRSVSILRSKVTLAEKLAALWPRLELISCWADGSAAHYLSSIQELFPNVEIQPKGLIGTEAFVSLPVVGYTGSALSVRSHFFEFQPVVSDSDQTWLADQLSLGEQYRVIVTTGGGLYRYQTHDVVEVVGFLEQCPLIRFVGRANKTCDLVGEKLSELFVASAIDRMRKQLDLVFEFAMLVPSRSDPIGYRLLIEYDQTSPARPSAGQIGESMKRLLSENPYFDHAVKVGQLAPLTVIVNNGNDRPLWDVYEDQCLSAGMRRGDIKPTALETRFDWNSILRPVRR
jgi:hypothetical protein